MPAIARLHRPVGVRVGHVQVGGGAPVVVQSMTMTDTADPVTTARQCIELPDKLQKILVMVLAEIADVNARQHHFFYRGLRHFGCGFHRLLNIVAAAKATCQWNGTKSTEIIAAVLHF